MRDSRGAWGSIWGMGGEKEGGNRGIIGVYEGLYGDYRGVRDMWGPIWGIIGVYEYMRVYSGL